MQKLYFYTKFLLAISMFYFLWNCSSSSSSSFSISTTEGDPKNLPVHVHFLKSDTSSNINSMFSRSKIEMIHNASNEIWSATGIGFKLEKVLEEDALNIADFDALFMDMGSESEEKEERFLRVLLSIRPDDSKQEEIFHIYITHRLPQGTGVYLGFSKSQQAIFYSEEMADDREAILTYAHELGHSLSLQHVTTDQNLMYSGGNGDVGKNLTDSQKKAALKEALTGTPYIFPKDDE